MKKPIPDIVFPDANRKRIPPTGNQDTFKHSRSMAQLKNARRY